jgi:hypothetical protein
MRPSAAANASKHVEKNEIGNMEVTPLRLSIM